MKGKGVDAHYTPPWLAKSMVAAIGREPHTVADYCVGSGALLEAAESRFGDAAEYLGVDVDGSAIRELRERHPAWLLSVGDLLSSRSIRSTKVRTRGGVDAILLNPPFSYRGGAGPRLRGPGDAAGLRVSPPVAFADSALRYLSPNGTAVFLMPANTLSGERDAWWWEKMRRSWRVSVELEVGPRQFPGVVAKMVLVKMSAGRSESFRIETPGLVSDRGSLSVIRGRVPVHRFWSMERGLGAQYVHSSSLQQSAVIDNMGWVDASLASRGPLVLLPRVGRLRRDKIVVWRSSDPLVLSDCVIGLRPTGNSTVEQIAHSLHQGYVELERAYAGSCAPYLTIGRLLGFLGHIGWNGKHVAAASE